MLGDQLVGNHAAANEVLLDDPFENDRIALAVPRALRIDRVDRTALADAEAVGLGTQDAPLLGQSKLFQTPLEKLPSHEPALLVTALWRRLIAAQQHVPTGCRHADCDGGLTQPFR